MSERYASVVKEGTLTKRAVSATFFKTWRSRRIVLVRSHGCTAIEWYRPDEAEPAGTLDIDHRTQVSKQGRNLLVRASGKELYLYHRDAAELAAWQVAITSCVPQAPQEAPSSSAASSSVVSSGALCAGTAGIRGMVLASCVSTPMLSTQKRKLKIT